jgi:hypothetical protein
MESRLEDKQLQIILSKGRKELPFPDFEEEMMFEVRKEYDRKNSVVRYIRLSWLFFLIGLVTGIVLLSVPTLSQSIIADINSNILLLSVLIIALCLLLLLFAEKLIRLSFFR